MSGSRPFSAERLPLTPRTNTGPYVHPRLPGSGRSNEVGRLRNPSAGVTTNQNGGASGGAPHGGAGGHQGSGSGIANRGSAVSVEQILDEVRRQTLEQRKCRDEVKVVSQLIARLEEY